MQIICRLENVFAESVAVGKAVAFVEDATGDAAAQVFDEVAVKLGIDLTNFTISVDFNSGGLGRGLLTFQNGRCGSEKGREGTARKR